jgi:hypothetical protein
MYITRMLVRVITERPWNSYDSFLALCGMERELKRLVAAGGLELEPMVRGHAQKVLEVDLNPVTIKTTEDGFQAKQEGFLAEENPFPLRSRKQKAWAAAHAQTDWGSARV